MQKVSRNFGLVLLWMLSLNALAVSDPGKVIEERYQSLQGLIDRGTLAAATTESELLAIMEKELSPVVDFRHVARKVMGRYARRASDEQLDRFTEVFKKTLISTYSKGLENLHRLDQVEISAARFDPEGDEAQVPMSIHLKGGQSYKVSYSLFRDDKGRWLVDNILVEGINIGLVMRNQFAHYMRDQGSVEKAIDAWGS